MDTRTELLTEIAAFQVRLKMADSKIGMIALNDPKFVIRLRDEAPMLAGNGEENPRLHVGGLHPHHHG